jgi:hypothetical protein
VLDFVTLVRCAEFVRRARLTYPGAFHHIVIFKKEKLKTILSVMLVEKTKRLKKRVKVELGRLELPAF